MTSAKFSGFWILPLPPCQYQIHATSLPLVKNWPIPSLPLRADVICACPLRLTWLLHAWPMMHLCTRHHFKAGPRLGLFVVTQPVTGHYRSKGVHLYWYWHWTRLFYCHKKYLGSNANTIFLIQGGFPVNFKLICRLKRLIKLVICNSWLQR